MPATRRARRSRRQWLRLLPAAALLVSDTARSMELQTLEQAQRKLFPGRRLIPADFKLAPEQHTRLKAEYRVPSMRPAVKSWRVDGGGWLYLDQVWGLNDVITYLVGLEQDGSLRGIEILVCADGYCDLYTEEWRARLRGRTHGRWEPTDAVVMVSGATLSCTHVAEGVKKILAIHARFRPAA